MRKRALILAVVLGIALLISPALQGSSDIETRLNQLEERIQTLEETVNVILEMVSKGFEDVELSEIESEPEWSHVISWKGNGTKTTEPFRVKKSWRIKWKNLGALLQIYVQNPNGDFFALPVNTLEEGEDISYVYETGEFYLTINSIGRWEVRIEEKT